MHVKQPPKQCTETTQPLEPGVAPAGTAAQRAARPDGDAGPRAQVLSASAAELVCAEHFGATGLAQSTRVPSSPRTMRACCRSRKPPDADRGYLQPETGITHYRTTRGNASLHRLPMVPDTGA